MKNRSDSTNNGKPELDLQVDRTLKLPMYLQICQRFKTAIEQGHLHAGDRVPAVRALATELNLARGTVEMAYRILTDEGYLQVRGAAGTVVSPSLPQPAVQKQQTPVPGHTVSGILDHDGKTPKPLQLGLPALDAFPRKVWNRIVAHRLRGSEPSRLAYPDPAGYDRLRERIATYLGVSRGVTCLSEQVFITTGLRNTLELTLSSLSTSGDEFWFEDPGYILARPFLQNAGVKLMPIPVDENGVMVEEGKRLSPYARFAMVTPSHQSPLGVTLSLERRMALLEWASSVGSWIIEDDYDSEFRYQGRPLPALKSLDRNDRVIYAGTFSKVMFPGLRLAYVVAPVSAVARFQAVAYNLNAGCPYLLQAGVADFIAEGHFSRHLKKCVCCMQNVAPSRSVFFRKSWAIAYASICGQEVCTCWRSSRIMKMMYCWRIVHVNLAWRCMPCRAGTSMSNRNKDCCLVSPMSLMRKMRCVSLKNSNKRCYKNKQLLRRM